MLLVDKHASPYLPECSYKYVKVRPGALLVIKMFLAVHDHFSQNRSFLQMVLAQIYTLLTFPLSKCSCSFQGHCNRVFYTIHRLFISAPIAHRSQGCKLQEQLHWRLSQGFGGCHCKLVPQQLSPLYIILAQISMSSSGLPSLSVSFKVSLTATSASFRARL